MDHRTNNLDGLRLVGALMVLVGHGFVLVGRGEETPKFGGFSLETLGVVIFFSISGYLIAASWASKRDLVAYFAARCLRIFPALAVLVVVTALVLGPLASSVGARSYFSDPLTWDYFRNIALYHQNVLPGVTDDLPYPASINGSLWTLPMEFVCYLLVPLLVLRDHRFRLGALLVVVLGLCWVAYQPNGTFDRVWGFAPEQFARFAVLFMAGSLIRLAVERWGRGVLRADVAVALLALHVLVQQVQPDQLHWYAWLTLPYVVLVVGMGSTPYFRRAARFGDLSYGMYLWAFPVQQLFVLWFGTTRLAVNFTVVALVTAALAYVSWHVVEKPSLAVKDKILARRAQRSISRQDTVGIP
ncbi:acyltransferase family protein [Nocardioides sp. CPCC 205120]|uniref:acyltransferase family protein n=1 Tax=Nocardioides sp. CPCC 205120 TaxID=3406462 RepID=UPI003B5109EC